MLNWIDQRVPVRYVAFFTVVALWVLSSLQLVVGQASLAWVLLLTALVVVGIHEFGVEFFVVNEFAECALSFFNFCEDHIEFFKRRLGF